MPVIRSLVLAGLVVAAVVAQAAVLPHVAVDGVVPDLVLLVVVAGAIVRGPEFGAGFGFLAGLLLDVAPPVDHVAGRWALAMVVAGFLAGKVSREARASALAGVATVAAGSFVALSLFAFTGMILGDGAVDLDAMAQVLLVGLLFDVMLAPFLLPVLFRVHDRFRPPQVLT